MRAAVDLIHKDRSDTAKAPAPEVPGDTTREAELHRNLLGVLASRIETTSLNRNAWIARNHRVTSPEFENLVRSVHQVATVSGMAGLSAICQLGSVLEALLAELGVAPSKLTWSAVRTINQAVDILPLLAGPSQLPHPGARWTPLVLTVDDEPVAREFLTTALESAHLNTLNVGDPALALRMCEQNHFDLAFLDIDMPRCWLRAHQRLHNRDKPRPRSSSSAPCRRADASVSRRRIDFINKPVMLSEVSVRRSSTFRTHLARAAADPSP
jgi:CheY-like chemotaxis protein